MKTIELRQAMHTLYDERSLSISDCYSFSKIKKVDCICYFKDDKDSKAIAEILQKHIAKAHSQPILIQAVEINLTANNYYQGWKYAIKFVSQQTETHKTLVICNSIIARIFLEFAAIDEMSGKFNIPDYIVDIKEFKEDKPTYWKKVPSYISLLKEQKAVYLKKSFKLTTTFVFLLSSLDCMEILTQSYDFDTPTRVLLVNDCPKAPKWFIKRQTNKFNKNMNKNFPNVTSTYYTQTEFKKEISNLDSAIMFVPQNKTWWKYYASPGVSFWIDADDISDLDEFGPMDFQSLCEDIVQFAEISPKSRAAQTFLKLYRRKKFNCLNQFVYWLRQ